MNARGPDALVTEVRGVPADAVPAVRRLHADLTGADVPLDALRARHREQPALFVGAYDAPPVSGAPTTEAGALVGYALGAERSDAVVELEGIGVVDTHRRRGLGSEVLAAFERRAADAGFARVTLGSAGGSVDAFYRANGYAAASMLVRHGFDEAAPEPDGDEVAEERVEDGTRKRYVAVDGSGSEFLDDVREEFEDSEAIYIMERAIDG